MGGRTAGEVTPSDVAAQLIHRIVVAEGHNGSLSCPVWIDSYEAKSRSIASLRRSYRSPSAIYGGRSDAFATTISASDKLPR